jgi:hypothetical protein
VTDSERLDLERVAASIADGVPVDWDALAAGGTLSPEEIRALRVLETVGRSTRVGAELDHASGFELLDELGRGSTGRVWRAFDRSLQREVALKVVTSGSASRRAAFLREARLLASVRHPGIVQVHSIHEQRGEICIVLELVAGRTLAEIARTQGPFSCAEAASIGVALCRALAVLHERGVVHRDLKPANVMREESGRVVLLDFGIARSPESSEPPNGAAGTPRFMAPEQFEDGAEVGPFTDLWELGALLYWLVSARFPFEGSTYEELARAVKAAPAPLARHCPGVDPRFAALVARALAPDRRERFQTAGELARELEALTGTPRRRRAWILGTALGLSGAALLAVWLGRSAGAAGLALEAELFARREGLDVRLRSNDTIALGDLLFLEASVREPFHLYVLDEDEAGEMRVLFPVPGFEARNPLAGELVHRLPGRFFGEAHYWVVTSDGGAETVLVVASREPLRALEELLATLPPVEPGAAPAYPAVSSETRALLLRGIAGTAPERTESLVPGAAAERGALEAFVRGLDPSPDRAVRVVRLRHRR